MKKYSLSKAKRLIAVLTVLIATITAAKANDSEYFAEGNHLVPLRQSDISVQKEILTIKICDDEFADIDVYYEFFNPGDDKEILMGFESCTPYFFEGDEYNGKKGHPDIKDFTVEMSGKRLPFNCDMVERNKTVDENGNIRLIDWTKWEFPEEGYGGTIVRKDKQDNDYDDKNYTDVVYAYHFKAPFKKGLNKVHHTYRYRMGSGVDFKYSIGYLLTPATRWANGKIDDFTLVIDAKGRQDVFYMSKNLFNGIKPKFEGNGKIKTKEFYSDEMTEILLRDAKAIFHIDNFRPTQELSIISSVSPMTGFMIFSEGKDTSIINNTAYTPSLAQSFEYIESDVVNKYTPKYRRILRNLPYAWRGHVFKDPELSKFFKQCWWYIPDPTGAYEKKVPLTDQEYKMIKRLK